MFMLVSEYMLNNLQSAEKLKNINESLSAFKSKNVLRDTPRSLKRLSFDELEEEDSPR